MLCMSVVSIYAAMCMYAVKDAEDTCRQCHIELEPSPEQTAGGEGRLVRMPVRGKICHEAPTCYMVNSSGSLLCLQRLSVGGHVEQY